MRLSLGATSIIIFTVFDSRHRRVPPRRGCIRTCGHLPLLGPEKHKKQWLHITCVHANSTCTLLFVFKTSHGKPPQAPLPPHTQSPQSRDCWRHFSNYHMERGAAEAKPFPSVAYSVTHGQPPALIKSYSDTGTSLPLFVCILWTMCAPLKPTAHGRRAVTRHSCLSSAHRFPRMRSDKPVRDFYASLDVTLT